MLNRVIILACIIVLTSCATMKTAEEIAAENRWQELTTKSFLDCASQKVIYLDDKLSEASTIALAVTNSCNAEYNNMILAYAATLENDNQRNKFIRKRNSKDSKISASVDIVLGYRNGILRR